MMTEEIADRRVLVVDADNGMTEKLLDLLTDMAPWKVDFLPAASPQSQILEEVRRHDYLISPFLKLDASFFENKGRLEAISVNAIGVNTIDLEAAGKAGVSVFALTDYCTDEVAEHAIAMMMALCRQLIPYREAAGRKEYSYMSVPAPLRVRDSCAGVFGFGRIGKAFALRALGLGMKVFFYQPEDRHYTLPESFKDKDVSFAGKEQIFEEADVISNHMSANENNFHFFDDGAFAAMKRKPVFLNTGRGVTVDTGALIRALDKGMLYGAGLDVLEDEHDLGRLTMSQDGEGRNVIVTPHAAFYSSGSMDQLIRQTARNLFYYQTGQPDCITRIAADGRK